MTSREDKEARLTKAFEDLLRAVAPGQAVVLYRGDRVLGGGWIERGLLGGGA